ncbi:6777_t:CDS:2 [Funneliformis caledonium]|uniref:6777_t:CDS:1 n=1 Tax=Funneliformis caledonium TaxID=1117310 RepID=A0A9N8Z974_9GLOM|nr:6777_t:CDS:2 [Funneliformis caledonium]
MWVLREGHPSSRKIEVNFTSKSPDLSDLKPILCQKFKALKDVEQEDIEFFGDKERTNPILSDVVLTSLNTSASSPISTILIEHGSWNLLRKITKTKYEKLTKSDFYFIVQNNSEERIENEYQFNDLVVRTKPAIKTSKKSYGEWNLKEVSSEIYNNEFDSIDSMNNFKVEELPELTSPFSEEELKRFVDNILEKLSAFHNEVNKNEATAREYISIFLTLAVSHARKHYDETTRLNVEFELDGSRGYGFLDYAVMIRKILILVNKAKFFEIEKAIAQNLVQIYSAVEVRFLANETLYQSFFTISMGLMEVYLQNLLGKRKLEQTGFETSPPPTMYGIVTIGRGWRFIRWNGTLESPKAEITEEYVCEFRNNNVESAKKSG